MCGKIIEEADPSTGADNAVELEAEPEPQKEEDADDANTTPPLAPSEADSVLRDSDADANTPTTTKPSTAPDLPPPAAPIEIKGETASSTSPPSD